MFRSTLHRVVDHRRNGAPLLLSVSAALFFFSFSEGARGQETEAAGVDLSGALTKNYDCDLTDDGRFVVFTDYSMTSVLKRDLLGNSTSAVITGGWFTSYPVISGDGSVVAFQTSDSKLSGDVNGRPDIYAVTPSGLVLVSTPDGTGGGSGNGDSTYPRISEDGNRIAFTSYATNLVPLTNPGILNVYVRDLTTSQTFLVSVGPSGASSNLPCGDISISDDGRFVSFGTGATNLLPGVSNGQVYIKDLLTGALVVGSIDSAGAPFAGSLRSSLSQDGRFLAFDQNGTLTLPNAIYVQDRDPDGNGLFDEGNGTIEMASRNSLGQPMGAPGVDPHMPKISDNGQFVLFRCPSSGDNEQNPSGRYEIFLRDRTTLQTTNVLVDSFGNHANGDGGVPNLDHSTALSGDGRVALFGTTASNLAPGDTNSSVDVYAHHVAKNPTLDRGGDTVGSNGFSPEFTVRGGLGIGESAEFRLRRAPASSTAMLVIQPVLVPGPGPNPPWPGGRPQGPPPPLPPIGPIVVPTDASGSATVVLTGGGGPFRLLMQWVISDPPLLPNPVVFSNKLEVFWSR